MTDVAADEQVTELRSGLRSEIREWCEAWKGSLQSVVSQVAGQAHVFEFLSEPFATADSDVWYTIVANGSVHGEMALRVPAASGTVLAQKLLGEAPASESVPGNAEFTPEHKEALEELMRQVAGLAATALASATGGELHLQLVSSGAPSWSSDAVVCLQTRDEPGPTVAIEIRISPALASELQARVQPKETSSLQASTSPPLSASDANYRRLMNVGLDVKLRFGTRRMLLRDVLSLSAGAVVELDNPLHSPVDLLLDGRLIAQGEVVIVDGKYGLRVAEVADTALAVGGCA